MWRNFIMLVVSSALVACAHVSTGFMGIGGGVKPVPETQNQYYFKVSGNAFATYDDFQQKAKEVITSFVRENNFEDYEVLSVEKSKPGEIVLQPYVKYTFKTYREKQARKLTKFKTKQEGRITGHVDFADDNPDFTEKVRQFRSLVVIADFSVAHFDANARTAGDAVVDLTESREANQVLTNAFIARLNAAGHQIGKTIHSSGAGVILRPYRVRASVADRDMPSKDLPQEFPPFYIDKIYSEDGDALAMIHKSIPSQDKVFGYAASLGKKYQSDALFIVTGYAQIPTKGREVMGFLDTVSMSSTHNVRAVLSRSVLGVRVRVIDANTGKQIGMAGRRWEREDPIAREELVAITEELLKNYPAR